MRVLSSAAMPEAAQRSQREIAVCTLIAVLFLVLNLLTASRSPTVAMDEVTFTEPAWNLANGHGFVIAGWNGQEHHFWTGNAPLYSLLLSLWLRVVPFTPAGVRSLNYLLTLLAALLICAAATRWKLIAGSAARILLFTALLCTYSIAFSYRGGRYDCTCILLLAIIFAAAAFSRFVVFLAAALIPLAGFQLPAYIALVSVLLLIAFRRHVVPLLVTIWSGIVVGIVGLYALFTSQGVWPEFLTTIGRHSIVHVANVEATSLNHLAGKWARLPHALLVDPLNLLLTIAVALLLWRSSAVLPRRVKIAGWLAVAIGVLLPPMMELLYMYRIYYGWTVVIPLLLALAAIHDVAFRRTTLALLLLAIVVGLPLRLLLTACEWRARDYRPVEQLVARNVGAADRVYTDFPAYYPVKRRAAAIALPLHVFPPYERMITPAQAAATSVIILSPDRMEDLSSFPGPWHEVDALVTRSDCPLRLQKSFGARLYDLHVFRRTRGVAQQ